MFRDPKRFVAAVLDRPRDSIDSAGLRRASYQNANIHLISPIPLQRFSAERSRLTVAHPRDLVKLDRERLNCGFGIFAFAANRTVPSIATIAFFPTANCSMHFGGVAHGAFVSNDLQTNISPTERSLKRLRYGSGH
jgi:hypothetical protein